MQICVIQTAMFSSGASPSLPVRYFCRARIGSAITSNRKTLQLHWDDIELPAEEGRGVKVFILKATDLR